MSENKISITGISGFVGQNLKNYLQENFQLTGVSRTPEAAYEMPYAEVNEDFLSNQTAFIHLAGKAHDLKKTSEEKDYFEVNTELTKTLFDKYLRSDCQTFIYMSSVKATADTVEGVLTETHDSSPITAYGKSKLAAEQYILSEELPKGKRVYVLRPCMIHGPNNKGNLNLLYSFVKKGIPYPFGAFENQRSFVSVDNLCFIIKELLENKDIPSGIYNISDDQALSTNELVSLMGEVLNKPAKILKLSKSLVSSIAKIGDVLPLPVNSERLQKLTENYVVSNEKIKKAINKELPFTSTEGLVKTLKSFAKEVE